MMHAYTCANDEVAVVVIGDLTQVPETYGRICDLTDHEKSNALSELMEYVSTRPCTASR